MTEKPITFSTPMVEAILGGQKTQTRRVINPKYKPDEYDFQVCSKKATSHIWVEVEKVDKDEASFGSPRFVWSKYIPSDIIWVKETWALVNGYDYGTDDFYVYKADCDANCESLVDKWRSSRYMPRKAARLFLEITSVRCEQLQDIGVDDAIAEGALTYDGWKTLRYKNEVELAKWNGTAPPFGLGPIERFMHLWNSINAKKGFGWATNPWVWVYDFERIKDEQS